MLEKEGRVYIITSFHNSHHEFPTHYAAQDWRSGELKVQRGCFLISTVVTCAIYYEMLFWVLVVNDYPFKDEMARSLFLVFNLKV